MHLSPNDYTIGNYKLFKNLKIDFCLFILQNIFNLVSELYQLIETPFDCIICVLRN